MLLWFPLLVILLWFMWCLEWDLLLVLLTVPPIHRGFFTGYQLGRSTVMTSILCSWGPDKRRKKIAVEISTCRNAPDIKSSNPLLFVWNQPAWKKKKLAARPLTHDAGKNNHQTSPSSHSNKRRLPASVGWVYNEIPANPTRWMDEASPGCSTHVNINNYNSTFAHRCQQADKKTRALIKTQDLPIGNSPRSW